jgi:hypothetical protein
MVEILVLSWKLREAVTAVNVAPKTETCMHDLFFIIVLIKPTQFKWPSVITNWICMVLNLLNAAVFNSIGYDTEQLNLWLKTTAKMLGRDQNISKGLGNYRIES